MKIVGQRLSNALVKEAAPDFQRLFLVADGTGLGAAAGSVSLVMPLIEKLMGGLWVGGTTYLTEDALLFRPNLANRFIHGDWSVRFPLTDLIEVSKHFGFVTQIIDAKTTSGTLRFRCYRRDSFFNLISTQIEIARRKATQSESNSADLRPMP